MTALPLNGFTVIDLTAHRAGPTAAPKNISPNFLAF